MHSDKTSRKIDSGHTPQNKNSPELLHFSVALLWVLQFAQRLVPCGFSLNEDEPCELKRHTIKNRNNPHMHAQDTRSATKRTHKLQKITAHGAAI